MPFPQGPFHPESNTTISLSNTSANVSIADPTYTQANAVSGVTVSVITNKQVMVTSPTSNPLAFVKLGAGSALAAATSDTPILPGTVQIFTPATGEDHLAAIVSAGTGTLYITIGEGQ